MPRAWIKGLQLTMSSRMSSGSEFRFRTAPRREFHPLWGKVQTGCGQLTCSSWRCSEEGRGRTAISGALRSAWSSGVSPRAPRRSRMASPMGEVPLAGFLYGMRGMLCVCRGVEEEELQVPAEKFHPAEAAPSRGLGSVSLYTPLFCPLTASDSRLVKLQCATAIPRKPTGLTLLLSALVDLLSRKSRHRLALARLGHCPTALATMSSPSSQSAPGYLWVFSEPGKSATLEEFQGPSPEGCSLRQDRVPCARGQRRLMRDLLAVQTGTTMSMSRSGCSSAFSLPARLETCHAEADSHRSPRVCHSERSIPEFETGARYQAADGFSPGWSAAYDIRSVALFSDPKYTRLRANRSKREGELVARLEVLDRRTAEKLGETSPPPPANEAPAFVLTLAGDERPDGQKDLERFKDVKGWRRSHYDHVYDSLIIGYGRQPESNVAPKYAVIHGQFQLPLPLCPYTRACRGLPSRHGRENSLPSTSGSRWLTFFDPCAQSSTPRTISNRRCLKRPRRAPRRSAGGSCTRPPPTRPRQTPRWNSSYLNMGKTDNRFVLRQDLGEHERVRDLREKKGGEDLCTSGCGRRDGQEPA